MNKFNSILFIATFVLALVFIFFGCSGDDGGDSEPKTGSCSYSVELVDKNATVEIGDQIWMKFNLAVEPTTGSNNAATNSWCYGEGGTDNVYASADKYVSLTLQEIEANCETYGRLYDWATAMALPDKCNIEYSEDCVIEEPHKGICPTGYHIPTSEDFYELFDYVYTENNEEGFNMMKATNCWYEDGNGTDEYGFSALPGGRYNNGKFFSAGYDGGWWTSSLRAYVYYIKSQDNRATSHYYNDIFSHYSYDTTSEKIIGHSVRCVKDQQN